MTDDDKPILADYDLDEVDDEDDNEDDDEDSDTANVVKSAQDIVNNYPEHEEQKIQHGRFRNRL